jgi:hypothetical protein
VPNPSMCVLGEKEEFAVRARATPKEVLPPPTPALLTLRLTVAQNPASPPPLLHGLYVCACMRVCAVVLRRTGWTV